MDATMSLPTSKTQKFSIGQDAGHGTDKISKFPEHILLHILSFLPTKDLIRTSILAKRWQHLWTSVSDIEFNDSDDVFTIIERPELQNSLLYLVDSAVCFRGDDYHIQKLRLALHMRVSRSRVMSWMLAAARHNVQELDLFFLKQEFIGLPPSLVNSKSLRKLKLESFSVLMVPSSVCFSSLKTLHLSCITFHDQQSTQQLFSGCVVLRKLVLYGCGWENVKGIHISIPTLRKLSIYYDRFFPDHLLDCEVKISAANLISLNCTSFLIIKLFLCNLPSLVDASIDVMNCQPSLSQEAAHRAVKLFEGLHNVKSLTLSDFTLECLSTAENLQAHLPTFHNLSDLHVNPGASDYCSGALIDFLQRSPNLECLDIFQGFDPAIYFNGEEWILDTAANCIKYRLKTLCISNFNGNPVEIEFLKHFLGNATILEKMRIFYSPDLSADAKKREEIENQLQMLPKSSASCTILVHFA